MEEELHLEDALATEPEFKKWLETALPEWESEYSGHILFALDAWKAGRAYQRREIK